MTRTSRVGTFVCEAPGLTYPTPLAYYFSPPVWPEQIEAMLEGRVGAPAPTRTLA
ncbi:hypothetical protein [Massilia sp. CT11-137]|uniref:hypothetical protein n=1 Tax=Massilia sp. CT11-137 TaxID=3393901 RepID=UPI0039A63A82